MAVVALRSMLLACAAMTLADASEQCDIQVWTHFVAAALGSNEVSCDNAPDYQGGCVQTLGMFPPEYLTEVLAASDGGGIGSSATTAKGYCEDLCQVGCFSPIAALPMWFASPCSPAIDALPGLASLRVYCGVPWGLVVLVLVSGGMCGSVAVRRRGTNRDIVTGKKQLLAVEMQGLRDENQDSGRPS